MAVYPSAGTALALELLCPAIHSVFWQRRR